MLEAGTDGDFNIRTQAAALNAILANARPELILEAALQGLPVGEVAAVSSFGTEAAVLLHMIAQVEPRTPVIFLDTGHLFPETLAYRDQLAELLGLSDVRTITPDAGDLEQYDRETDLWSVDPDFCCHIRKVKPLQDALSGVCAWINGRKRFHGGERSVLRPVEADGRRLKFNPLASVDREVLQDYFRRHSLPRHPLEVYGFSSIGCMPCTSRVAPGDDVRAGRWAGRSKSECGIHSSPGKTTIYQAR